MRTLEEVERRIHDGVADDRLHERAQRYVDQMFMLYPWLAVPPEGVIVEVGPGVGYIMQAIADRVGAQKLIGLDVAAGMIRHACARVARDGLASSKYRFVAYNGVDFPFADHSVDFFYSVAAVQHIPKPFAYNLLLEMMRCLKPTGCAVVHLLSWEQLAHQQVSFSTEIRSQILGEVGHWHHFYDRTELERIMEYGLRAPYFHVREYGTSMWVAWGNDLRSRRAAYDQHEFELKQKVEQQNCEIVSLQRSLGSIMSSKSWRLTKPVRRFAAGLRATVHPRLSKSELKVPEPQV